MPDHNFAIDMPPDWQFVVVPNALCLAPQASPQVALTIGYRGPIEDVNIVRSGVGAGDLITRGTAIILGKTVPRIVLVYQGKDKAILYNYATEINTPQIVLTASLDDWRTDYDAAVLTPTLQTTADQIVATLATVTLSPTWKTYTSPTFHVSVHYPPNWHPDSSGQALYSGPDGFFSITAALNLAPTAQIACQITLADAQTHNGLAPNSAISRPCRPCSLALWLPAALASAMCLPLTCGTAFAPATLLFRLSYHAGGVSNCSASD